MNNINIEQAMITAHQCASSIQNLGAKYAWMRRRDPEFCKHHKRATNEQQFLAYLFEEGGDTLLRQSALVEEIKLLELILEGHHSFRCMAQSQTPPADLNQEDADMMQTIKPQAIIAAARLRVEDSYKVAQTLLERTSNKPSPKP